jgi:membrane peptidoglycan carboxypeptidase
MKPRFRDGARPSGRVRLGLLILVILGLFVVLLGAAVVWETRTSTFEARWISAIDREISYSVGAGPSSRIVFPGPGPYDNRLGYSRIPEMVADASERGFAIVDQARVSPRFQELVADRGIFPIYREKPQAGLEISDRRDDVLSQTVLPARIFASFDAIPPVVWETLLFIENRSLLDPDRPFKNPAVEWPRLFLSATELGFRLIGREGNVPGASTLATQIEKFRHSPEGLTSSPRDKLLQMASASLRAYMDGPETLPARRRIVLDYLNSVPLAAQRGEGEVIGLGDGLWSWYGRDLDDVGRALGDRTAWAPGAPDTDTGGSDTEASGGEIYREVLSLLLAQRRPTYFLTQAEGRSALDGLTTRYLDLLEEGGVIPSALAAEARSVHVEPRVLPPSKPEPSFVERKGVNAVRTQLLGVLGVPALYDLDRLDLSVRTTIDGRAQAQTTDFLLNLADSAFVHARGLDGYRLLDRGDPSAVVYSVVLQERTDRGNLVRIQTDNLDAPFNLNESARLELGSTAKLRTLATYLQLVAELHDTLSGLDADSLAALPLSRNDPLARWARSQIQADPDIDVATLLRRSLSRTYSANPGERFVTGGGVQTFSNFDNTYDQSTITVAEAFQQSVNLVFVRVMRDIVNHYMYRVPGSTAYVLDETDSPLRQEYLERFADREGTDFLRQFYPKYDGKTRGEILEALIQDRRLSPQRTAWAYRAVASDATVEELAALLRTHETDADIGDQTVRDLFGRANPANWDLADLGYLASVHPLELWLARYLIEHPGASLADAIRDGADARQDVYGWLFRTSRRSAQDRRIRFLLESEAFTNILEGWRRLGYPFENIVPSLGTAIGSSGDRPSALGELVGIIVNDGVRLPTYRVEELEFAEGTPFETRMVRDGAEGERVMRPEVAQVLREAMTDVVRQGTARRMSGVLVGPDGAPLTVGGKTGTGDNRYRTFAPGGRLIESRSVNRTSTFVFFIEDRFYGVVTAYVPGEAADDYWFTSALPTQILRELAPVVQDLLAEPAQLDDARSSEVPAGIGASGSP